MFNEKIITIVYKFIMQNNNPLSPHLQIYKWHISSLLSITHRVVGVINFFALITIGISGAVKIKFGIFLTLVIIAILISIKYLSKVLYKFNFEYPSLIYSEGNSYNTIEITAKKRIKDLENEK